MSDQNQEFFPSNLHKCLRDGISQSDDGIYLVCFRVLQKDSNILVYSYMYYPTIFLNSILAYLIIKANFKNSMVFKEWGDYFTIVDENLSNDEYLTNLRKNHFYSTEHFEEIRPYVDNINDYISYFDLVKKMSHIDNYKNILSLIDYGIKKDYPKFLDIIFKGFIDVSKSFTKSDIYVLKGCLFVVKDLNNLLTDLKKLGYIVNRGPKSKRDHLNSMNSFLSTVDIDYRNALYKCHLSGIKNGIVPYNTQLSRSKFSFNNIHMNIGNVKYYSTLRTISVEDKRQQLFDDNYDIIRNILDNNYYQGSESVQKEIEIALYNQENHFSDVNKIKNRFKFNEQSYELLIEKHKELCNLLDLSDELVINTKIYSGRYIPLVKLIITELKIDTVANLLLSYLMEFLSNQTHTIGNSDTQTPGVMSTKAFHDFGKKIFKKFIYNKYIKSDEYLKDSNNYSFSEFVLCTKNEYKDIHEVDGSYAMLGGYFVWNLVTINLLYQTLDKHPDNNVEHINYLKITQVVREKLFSSNIRIFHLPQKLPMVCEPKEWVHSTISSKNKLGGYLLNDIYYDDKLIKDKIGYEIPTILKEDNLVIPMANGIMKTPYKINVDTLEFVYKYGINKNIILDSDCVKDYLENPNKKYTKKATKNYRSVMSKLIMEKNVLNIADVYSKQDKIYFPVRFDFRLRIYCATDYFDYQKNDLAKGLILFANPGCIRKTDKESIKYFKAYGANMYGNGLDKKSLNHRDKWVDKFTDKILNFEYNDIVDQAENKTCFVSFCFEYVKFVKFMNSLDDMEFYTYLPIQLDATCNGYQHLSLLTKETKLLSQLNLDFSTHDDDPNDFYSYISSQCLDFINNEINTLSETKSKTSKIKTRIESLIKIKNVKFDRDIYKLIIMRDSYSAGITKISESIMSNKNMKEQGKDNNLYFMYKDSDIKLTRQDIYIFVGSIKRVIRSIAPKIINLSKYLNGIVNICTILGMPIPWGLPSGVEITESYLKEEEKKIPAFTFTKSKYTFKKYLSGKYDIKKQKRAIRPNLIHSLDACVIAELYQSLKFNNIDLYTVHDCFAVTANHVQKLINKFKLVYIKLYSSTDYLAVFDTMLKVNINNTFGDTIYKLNDKYIKIPNKSKFKEVEFPDINEIIKLDKKLLKKVRFPDITIMTNTNKNISINKLKDSSNILI